MSLRNAVLSAVFAALTFLSCTAHAQLGVYGEFTVNRLGGILSSPQPTPNITSQRTDTVDPLGGTGGIYYDFKKLGPGTLGVDLRGSILTTKRGAYYNYNGAGARLDSVLGGIRYEFHVPPKYRLLKPYIEGLAGLGKSDYGLLYNGSGVTDLGIVGNSTVLQNNFQYQGLIGIDIKLFPILDFRAAELGYGGLDPFGTYSHNYPIRSASTGFVFHLP